MTKLVKFVIFKLDDEEMNKLSREPLMEIIYIRKNNKILLRHTDQRLFPECILNIFLCTLALPSPSSSNITSKTFAIPFPGILAALNCAW